MGRTKMPGTATHPNLRYTMESVRVIAEFKERVGDVLKELAIERALSEGRDLVKPDDVFACWGSALREALNATTVTAAD